MLGVYDPPRADAPPRSPVLIRSDTPRVTNGRADLVLKGEDRATCSTVTIGGEEILISMVADGHGGNAASIHCHAHLLDYFVEAAEAANVETSGKAEAKLLRQAARTAFVRLHEEVLAFDPPTTAGTTLTLAAVNPARREVTCAHVGDSVALLIPHDGTRPVTELCQDHRIDTNAAERERLTALGGLIAHATGSNGRPGGPLRLWPGGVAQARTIGDSDIDKFNDPRPFTCSYPFTPDDRFDVVVCSDGVWDALLHDSVAALCRRTLGCTARVAARLVVGAALQQRHAYDNNDAQIPRDDTSCIVLRVGESEDAKDQMIGFNGCLACSE